MAAISSTIAAVAAVAGAASAGYSIYQGRKQEKEAKRNKRNSRQLLTLKSKELKAIDEDYYHNSVIRWGLTATTQHQALHLLGVD